MCVVNTGLGQAAFSEAGIVSCLTQGPQKSSFYKLELFVMLVMVYKPWYCLVKQRLVMKNTAAKGQLPCLIPLAWCCTLAALYKDSTKAVGNRTAGHVIQRSLLRAEHSKLPSENRGVYKRLFFGGLRDDRFVIRAQELSLILLMGRNVELIVL